MASEFEAAIQGARNAQLLNVDTKAKVGLPYYTLKTLDPVWNKAATDLIRINKLEMHAQDKKPVTDGFFKGKKTLISFFFTSCAGFCPFLIKNLQRIEIGIEKKFGDIQYVAISVDPQNDTFSALKNYQKKLKLNDNWKLLRGEEDYVYKIAHETFAAEAFKLPKSKGQIAHSEHFYVIDEEGYLRGVLNGTRRDVAQKAEELFTSLEKESKEK